MESLGSSKTVKTVLAISSSIAIGYLAYKSYVYWKKKQCESIDEGFVDVSKIEEPAVKNVLVLGLQNAGKSAILSQLTSESLEKNKSFSPTEGFYVMTMQHNGTTLNIWELGGNEKVRAYWGNFLQNTDVLIFVVDSSDQHNMSVAGPLLKWLLSDERLAKVPVLLLANKQDVPGAMSPSEVAESLELRASGKRHAVTVLGTQTLPGSKSRHSSITEAKDAILRLVSD